MCSLKTEEKRRKHADYMREYTRLNRERINSQRRVRAAKKRLIPEWSENKKRVDRENRRKNIEKYLATEARWRDKNRETIRQRLREFKRINRDMVLSRERSRRKRVRVEKGYLADGFKEWLVAKNGGKCIRCGYNEDAWGMDFHHQNPSEKRNTISLMIAKTKDSKAKMSQLAEKKGELFDEIMGESRKCVLLCRNCHAIFHHLYGRKTRWDETAWSSLSTAQPCVVA